MHPCVGVISIKLQRSFVKIELLHGCSPMGLLCICKAFFLKNTPGGVLLNTDNFIYVYTILIYSF